MYLWHAVVIIAADAWCADVACVSDEDVNYKKSSTWNHLENVHVKRKSVADAQKVKRKKKEMKKKEIVFVKIFYSAFKTNFFSFPFCTISCSTFLSPLAINAQN